MFRHLMVPLDGSPLAEAALPAARYLAATLGAQVTLLHMIERHAPHAIHGQPHLATAADAENYLARLVEQTLPSIPTVQRHVHTSKINDVAQSIVSHAEELQTDLIVLCTHGAGGVRHGLFGTVAQQVIALGTTPVLLVPTPTRASDRVFSCRRLLVPLDGNPDHEQGLEAVANFGTSCGEYILLLMVIPIWSDAKQAHLVTSRLLPGTTVELLDASLNPAQAYLDAKLDDVRRPNRELTARVVRGAPVTEIETAARDFDADIIVLGTHGTTNLDAFWSGSVTPQLARNSHLPMLLVPVSAASTSGFPA